MRRLVKFDRLPPDEKQAWMVESNAFLKTMDAAHADAAKTRRAEACEKGRSPGTP
jgi:erythromycin esterase-like protein